MKKFTYALLATSMIAGAANAQTVDYGTLESIFGEPVTTSATGKPQRVSEAPVAMEIVTQEDIRRSGAKDIPQALRHLSGVEVLRSFIGGTDVSIRGYSQPQSTRVLVLMNGRQVLLDYWGNMSWPLLPVQMSEIRQIEVIKGPASSVYGFNAELGVINIITYDPLKDDINAVEGKLGNRQHQQGSVVKTIKMSDDMGLRLSGGIVSSDGFNRDSFRGTAASKALTRSDDAMIQRNINADYSWQIDDTSVLRTQAAFSNARYQDTITYNSPQGDPERAIAFQVDYKKDTDSGLWGFSTYRYSHDWNSSIIGVQSDLTVAKVDNLFKVGSNHAFRAALEYRNNVGKGDMFGGGNAKFSYDVWAPSLMHDWKISPKLSWTNSVRYDNATFGTDEAPAIGPFTGDTNSFDRIIEEFTFNSGLVYNVTNTDKLRFTVARGVHLPSLVEMGAAIDIFSLGQYSFTGVPTLQPERALSFELGYTKKLPEHNMEFTGNVFYTKMENMIKEVLDSSTIYDSTFNEMGDSDSMGLELSLKGHVDDFRWKVNYTGMSIKDDTAEGTFGLHFEGSQPKHQIALVGGYDHDKWEFDSELLWQSNTVQRFSGNEVLGNTPAQSLLEEKIENYFLLNMRVGYNVNENTNVYFTGYNLVDRHAEVARGENAAFGERGGNSLGRSIIFGVKHNF